MKIVLWIIGLLIALSIAVYILVFTPTGNAFLSPMLEAKIQEKTQLESKLRTFSLNLDNFEVLVDLDEYNQVHLKGGFDLLQQSFDAVYNVKLQKLENLEALTKKPLQGALFTDGKAKGTLKFMEIDGKSDLALSDTIYHVELTNLDVSSIVATSKEMDLKALLELLKEKRYALGKIDADINFKSIKEHQLDGNVLVTTKGGEVNSDVLLKEFDIAVPQTNFTMNLDATLKDDDILYHFNLDSNLAKIKSGGNVTPQPLKVDVIYDVDVKELAVLRPIIKQDIRGPLAFNGGAKGTRKNMIVEGVSDIAGSQTHFSTILTQLKPSSLNANVDNLKIEKLLYMLKQPHYGNGILTLNVDMHNLQKGKLDGTVISSVKKGLLNSKVLTQEAGFKSQMPQTQFTLVTNTTLKGDMTQTKLNLQSNLISLEMQEARYNLANKVLQSDFVTRVANLDDLFFLTERHLKGAITLEGDINKTKTDLDLIVRSNIADGTLGAQLHNDDLDVDFNSIKTTKALEILMYPEIFDASLDGKLNYNLKEKKGLFKGDVKDGKFTPNTMFTLVKKYAKIDLYKEKFVGDVSADINKENLLASLKLSSNSSSLGTTNAKLNSKEKTIDATIDISANKHPISVTLKGDTSSPKVGIDAQSLMKEEVQKAVGDKINNLLKSFF